MTIDGSRPAAPGFAGPLQLLAGGIALGFAPIGLRMGLAELGPQAIAFWRYLFAVPVLLALNLVFARRLPRLPNLALFLAAACFTLDMALWHASLTMTSVSNATFIVNLGNIGLGLAAFFLLKEQPSRLWMRAALLALVGAFALSMGGAKLERGALAGDALALIAALFVAGYMLYSKEARGTHTALEVMFWLSVFEAGLSVIAVIGMGEDFFPEKATGFLTPLALALVVQVAGQGLIVSGLGSTNTALAGILVLAQPVVAAFVSWFAFEETLTVIQFAGAGVILLAVWLARRPTA
jgi:drug/metabolite transporter (DMT)-like permease